MKDIKEEAVRISELAAEEALLGAIDLLTEELRGIQAEPSVLVRDVVAIDYASQVLEASQGVRALLNSDASGVAGVLARRAFEAFHELLELLGLEENGSAAAADALVASVFTLAKNQGLLSASAEALGMDTDHVERITAREFLRRVVESFRHFSGSSATEIEQAVVRAKGTKKAAVSLRRTERIRHMSREPQLKDAAHVFEAYWSSLSMQAHPHVRLGTAVFLSPNGVTVKLRPDKPDDSPGAVVVAVACTTAILCRKYLGTERPDQEPSGRAT